jgi:hypothetical protein
MSAHLSNFQPSDLEEGLEQLYTKVIAVFVA